MGNTLDRGDESIGNFAGGEFDPGSRVGKPNEGLRSATDSVGDRFHSLFPRGTGTSGDSQPESDIGTLSALA